MILIFPLQLFRTQYVLPCLAGEKGDIFENRSTLPSPKHQGRRHTRPLLISLAPLTNVALALNLEPKLPQLCPVPWDEQEKMTNMAPGSTGFYLPLGVVWGARSM